MSENIQNRVHSIFEKIHNISSSVQDEKNFRFHLVSQMIMSFEANLQQISDSKEEKFGFMGSKVKQLEEFLTFDSEERQRQESETFKLITDLERHAKRLIESNSKERFEGEKKIVYSINQQIEGVQQEVIKEGHAQSTAHLYLDAFLNEDLPKITDELQIELGERKDVEEKIFHQFVEQLNDLKEMFERQYRFCLKQKKYREKKEREIKEEEIVELLREISGRISESLRRSKTEREKTEEHLVQLVEKVIEKLKREMLEMNI